MASRKISRKISLTTSISISTTGGLVSNLGHPQVHKTKQHTPFWVTSFWEQAVQSNLIALLLLILHPTRTLIWFEHTELPAKLPDYFLRSNESNINQGRLSAFWKVVCSSLLRWRQVSATESMSMEAQNDLFGGANRDIILLSKKTLSKKLCTSYCWRNTVCRWSEWSSWTRGRTQMHLWLKQTWKQVDLISFPPLSCKAVRRACEVWTSDHCLPVTCCDSWLRWWIPMTISSIILSGTVCKKSMMISEYFIEPTNQ